MRHEVASLVAVIVIAGVIIFLLAPVVDSPVFVECGGACKNYGGTSYYIPAYESPSCAILGVGAGYSSSEMVYGPQSHYQLSCPIRTIFAP